jgi:N-acetyl-alpha-D-muramate 1-phosphate uridylyltransferase
MKIENAMVLAAGLGTRMRPITDTTPKPLVRIAGKAMIDYALDSLAEAGVKTAAVNIHHHPEQMIDHLGSRTVPRIVISDERDALMNSGGGLVKGLRLLPGEPVFVMNADLFWIGEPDNQPSSLSRLAKFFDPNRMDMAMLVVRNENTTGHNGKLDFDLAVDGKLNRYRDGMANPVVYAGAFVLNPALLDDAPDTAFNLNIYFDKAIQNGRLFGLELLGHWITVGTPEAIFAAEETIAKISVSKD